MSLGPLQRIKIHNKFSSHISIRNNWRKDGNIPSYNDVLMVN